MEDFSSKNLNNTPASNTVFLGTPQAVKENTYWSEQQAGGFIICQANGYLATAELIPAVNSHSECQYAPVDPFKNMVASKRETSYEDSAVLPRYNLTSSAVDYFAQTFPNNNLQGDEWSVACLAFSVEDSGYSFCILIHPSETALLNFCKMCGWSYREV